MSDKTTKHNINSCVFLSLPGQETACKPLNKVEMRRQYLMEKYVWKWKQFMRSRSEGLFPRLLKLGHNNWLRQVMLLRICRPSDASDLWFSHMGLVDTSYGIKFFFSGALHPSHSGSETSCMHHRRGPDNYSQSQTAGPGSPHKVEWAIPIQRHIVFHKSLIFRG